MCPIDDGVIKYDRSHFEKTKALPSEEFQELEKWRSTLFQLRLIGEYLPEKIGYGNLSEKKDYSHLYETPLSQFIISGTQTGGLANLDGNSYVRVLDFNFDTLLIKAQGPLEASSEALTHAAIYDSSPSIQAVFHIHSNSIWKGMIEENYPATPKEVPYGTKEMALTVKDIIAGQSNGLLVMKGHEDGVIAFGECLSDAGKKILEVYDKFGG